MKIKHTPLKYLAAGLCLGAAALAQDVHGQANTDALIDQLLKKGVLTESEAKSLRAAPAAKPAAAPAGSDIKLSWKDGLSFESADKKTFKGKLGGRVDLDIAAFDESDEVEAVTGPNEAGVEFRRARLAVEGEIGTALPTLYKVEFDFAHSTVATKDLFLALTEIPALGTFQIGHFKEPISLDILPAAVLSRSWNAPRQSRRLHRSAIPEPCSKTLFSINARHGPRASSRPATPATPPPGRQLAHKRTSDGLALVR